MSKVLASQEAVQTVQDILRTLNQLQTTIQDLDSRGKTLSNPEVWDGAEARAFRGEWPGMASKLRELEDTLEQISREAQRTIDEIIRAGGGL